MTKLHTSDGAVLGTFPVGKNPVGVAFDGFSVWVASQDTNSVTRLRGTDGYLLGTFAVGVQPQFVAFDGTSIWVTSQASNSVTNLSACDGSRLGTFPAGDFPAVEKKCPQGCSRYARRPATQRQPVVGECSPEIGFEEIWRYGTLCAPISSTPVSGNATGECCPEHYVQLRHVLISLAIWDGY